MRRIAYLSNNFVRIEDFFAACFGLWIVSFLLGCEAHERNKKFDTVFAVFIVFRYMPYMAQYSLMCLANSDIIILKTILLLVN